MDKITLEILKIFSKRYSLTCEQIAAIIGCGAMDIASEVSYLYSNHFISCVDIDCADDKRLHLTAHYKITVEGRNQLVRINKDNWRFRIPVIISVAALAISAISLIISLWQ